MIYQIRNMNGSKLLERESADEVRHYLHSRPELRDCEVWELHDFPGGLRSVTLASEFMNESHQKKQHEMFK